jgi:hypothetical protein
VRWAIELQAASGDPLANDHELLITEGPAVVVARVHQVLAAQDIAMPNRSVDTAAD